MEHPEEEEENWPIPWILIPITGLTPACPEEAYFGIWLIMGWMTAKMFKPALCRSEFREVLPEGPQPPPGPPVPVGHRGNRRSCRGRAIQ